MFDLVLYYCTRYWYWFTKLTLLSNPIGNKTKTIYLFRMLIWFSGLSESLLIDYWDCYGLGFRTLIETLLLFAIIHQSIKLFFSIPKSLPFLRHWLTGSWSLHFAFLKCWCPTYPYWLPYIWFCFCWIP